MKKLQRPASDVLAAIGRFRELVAIVSAGDPITPDLSSEVEYLARTLRRDARARGVDASDLSLAAVDPAACTSREVRLAVESLQEEVHAAFDGDPWENATAVAMVERYHHAAERIVAAEDEAALRWAFENVCELAPRIDWQVEVAAWLSRLDHDARAFKAWLAAARASRQERGEAEFAALRDASTFLVEDLAAALASRPKLGEISSETQPSESARMAHGAHSESFFPEGESVDPEIAEATVLLDQKRPTGQTDTAILRERFGNDAEKVLARMRAARSRGQLRYPSRKEWDAAHERTKPVR